MRPFSIFIRLVSASCSITKLANTLFVLARLGRVKRLMRRRLDSAKWDGSDVGKVHIGDILPAESIKIDRVREKRASLEKLNAGRFQGLVEREL